MIERPGVRGREHDMADPMEAVRRLLDLRHRSRPEDLPPILDSVAPLLGAERIIALMIDYEQISLWPLHGTAGDNAGGFHAAIDRSGDGF